MGVMLQAFYWDCPTAENREHEWWVYIKSKLPSIAQAGFAALWLPPANKAAGWKSMGYDPYDYYDLGEFDHLIADPGAGAAKGLYPLRELGSDIEALRFYEPIASVNSQLSAKR